MSPSVDGDSRGPPNETAGYSNDGADLRAWSVGCLRLRTAVRLDRAGRPGNGRATWTAAAVYSRFDDVRRNRGRKAREIRRQCLPREKTYYRGARKRGGEVEEERRECASGSLAAGAPISSLRRIVFLTPRPAAAVVIFLRITRRARSERRSKTRVSRCERTWDSHVTRVVRFAE